MNDRNRLQERVAKSLENVIFWRYNPQRHSIVSEWISSNKVSTGFAKWKNDKWEENDLWKLSEQEKNMYKGKTSAAHVLSVLMLQNVLSVYYNEQCFHEIYVS